MAKSIRNNIVLAIGCGIGVLWIAVASLALWTAFSGLADGKPDFALGWGLVGGLLFAAGSAAIIATWWHQHRYGVDR